MSAAQEDWLITAAAAAARIPAPPAGPFVEMLHHGSMVVELYTPRDIDRQQPHTRDELYVVWRGTGVFFRGGERKPFGPGDVIFVPAHMEHRFEEFSDDFATWVIFWGPEGGETT